MARERLLQDGPAEYWSPDKAPTAGQYRGLAIAACKLLDIPVPRTRAELTEALLIVRLAYENTPERSTEEVPF